MCAEPASDCDPAKTSNANGHSVARCQYNVEYVTFIEKITEYSLLLQHLSIYYNDNHSLSDLLLPLYVVLATYITIQTSWVIMPCLSYVDEIPGSISINPVSDELRAMPITPSPSPFPLSTQFQVTDEGNAQEAASSTPTTSIAENSDANSVDKVPSGNSPFLGEH